MLQIGPADMNLKLTKTSPRKMENQGFPGTSSGHQQKGTSPIKLLCKNRSMNCTDRDLQCAGIELPACVCSEPDLKLVGPKAERVGRAL